METKEDVTAPIYEFGGVRNLIQTMIRNRRKRPMGKSEAKK